jgi:hypothetical protein
MSISKKLIKIIPINDSKVSMPKNKRMSVSVDPESRL